MYIKDVNTCLTSVEAAYVYSQIESDKIIYPIADSDSATPANFFSMIGEFTTMYQISEMYDEVQATLPFANCDTQEISNFFGHAEVITENNDYLVDLAYGPNTKTTDIVNQTDDDWSILTPFPRYTTPTLDPNFKQVCSIITTLEANVTLGLPPLLLPVPVITIYVEFILKSLTRLTHN